MDASEVRRLKLLEEENKKLKALVADLSFDKQIMQDVLSKKLLSLLVAGSWSRKLKTTMGSASGRLVEFYMRPDRASDINLDETSRQL